MPQAAGSARTTEPARRRRLLWAAGLLLVSLILLGTFLPTIVSTRVGKSIVLGIANRMFDGKIQVEQLSLGWSAGQSVEGVAVYDAAGKPVVSARTIEASGVSLWSALRGDMNFGHVRVVGAVLQVKQPPEQPVRRQPAPETERRPKTPTDGTPKLPTDASIRVFPDLSIKLELIDAKVNYVSANPDESIEVMFPAALLDIPDPSRIHAAFDADVCQGAHHGRLKTNVTLTNLFDADGMVRPEGFKIDGEAEAAQVPVAFLDRTLQFDGLLESVLGPILEADFHARGDGQQFDASISVQSSQLSMNGQFVRHDGEITVKPDTDVTANLKIEPQTWHALASRFAAFGGTTFDAPITIFAKLTDLVVPATDRRINWPHTRIAAKIRVDDVSLDVPGARPILLTGTALTLNSQTIASNIEASLTTVGEYDGQRSNLAISVSVENAIAPDDESQGQEFKAKINGQLIDFPVVLLDHCVPQIRAGASDAIGPRLDVVFDARFDDDDARPVAHSVVYTVDLASQRLHGELAGTMDLALLAATSTGSIQFSFDPDMLRRLTNHFADRIPQELANLTLAPGAAGTLTLDAVSVSLASFDVSAASGTGSLAIQQLTVSGISNLDPVSIHGAVLALDKKQGADYATFQFKSQVTHGSLFSTNVSDKGLVRAGGTVRSLSDPAPTVDGTCGADLTVSPRLVTLLKSMNVLVLPKAWQTVNLAGATRMRADLTDLRVPLSTPFDAATITADLAFGIDELSIDGADQFQNLTLRQIKIKVDDGTLVGPINFRAGVTVATEDKAGRIEVDGTFRDLGQSDPAYDVRIRTDKVTLPLRLLQKEAGNAAVTLNAQIACRMEPGKHVFMTEPSFVELDVTPQLVSDVVGGRLGPRGERILNLASPARLRINLRKAHIGLIRTVDAIGATVTHLDPTNSSLELTAVVPAATFHVIGSDRQIAIRNLIALLSSTGLSGTSDLDLDGTVQTLNPITGETDSTLLTSSTRISNLFGPNGSIAMQRATVHTTTNLPNLPVDVIETLASMKGKLVAGIGPVASMKLEGDVPGTVSLHFASPTVDVPIKLKVQRSAGDVQITLPEEINAKLMLTEQSSKALFGHVHPVFGDTVASEDWIRIRISKEPFYVPLKDFKKNIQKLAILARLEIGTVRMRRKGWLTEGLDDLTSTAAKILRSARSPSNRSVKAQTYLARFTPIDLSIRNGMLTTSEFWITSDDLAIGFQSPQKTDKFERGGSNLLTGKYRFAMGLLGASLIAEEPFLIEVIDPTTIFDIPIAGNITGQPEIQARELRLPLLGSLTKQQARRLGRDVQDLIDLIGRRVERDRRRKHGLSWNMPDDALSFAQQVGKERTDKNSPRADQPAPEEEPEPRQRPRKKRKIEDELIDQLPGLIDEFLK